MTIAAMLAIGTLTRFSGIDATLGLAFAHAGFLYPFFGTLLGWLGVALTGSDTASNVLFGGLQKITAEQLGLSPILMAAANSSGGVMGKMIDAQSIVVASTATNWFGHEGSILRFVFWHSIPTSLPGWPSTHRQSSGRHRASAGCNRHARRCRSLAQSRSRLGWPLPARRGHAFVLQQCPTYGQCGCCLVLHRGVSYGYTP